MTQVENAASTGASSPEDKLKCNAASLLCLRKLLKKGKVRSGPQPYRPRAGFGGHDSQSHETNLTYCSKRHRSKTQMSKEECANAALNAALTPTSFECSARWRARLFSTPTAAEPSRESAFVHIQHLCVSSVFFLQERDFAAALPVGRTLLSRWHLPWRSWTRGPRSERPIFFHSENTLRRVKELAASEFLRLKLLSCFCGTRFVLGFFWRRAHPVVARLVASAESLQRAECLPSRRQRVCFCRHSITAPRALGGVKLGPVECKQGLSWTLVTFGCAVSVDNNAE